MEKLRKVLVTDRTKQTVNRAAYLRSLYDKNGVWRGSKAELEELRASTGIYTPVDLNRVLRACSWLAGRLERYGYSVPGDYFPAVLIEITVEPEFSGIANSFLAYRGEQAVAIAFDKDGFEFSRWEEHGETVSTDAEYIFTAETDRELTAVFDVPPAEASGVVGYGVVGMATVGKGL